ncbi:MAG TPA: hypothetical protein PKC55_10365 [Dysgonomonas sp.]|uniref:hypothetical protein n=1 Tax=unclassified Dysgonomonas TaxID=2630389 RepID=UPI0025BBB681|nr:MULTISPECIES: hypothetical protein [unclassified Dysgonomonas]HML65223.1 hypothetical protein [Dysgonomonas sp.]
MKNLRITGLVIVSMLLVSCSLIDFSEDCTYYGDVEIKPDWSGLVKDGTKPALTDIYLLSPQANYSYRISADTLVKGVQAVSYKVLAFNSYGLSDISLSGMDCPETAKAVLKVSEENGKLYTVQAPAFYAANDDLTVPPFERGLCEPVLKPAVRQINIDFIVLGNGTQTEVKRIDGELSGIPYMYGFKQLDGLESAARLAFITQRNEKKDNVFSSDLRVFGINPDKQGEGRIDNLLDITLQVPDGNTYRETVDLTDVFSDFTTRIINITIEIRLGIMGIEVTITGWNVSDGGVVDL